MPIHSVGENKNKEIYLGYGDVNIGAGYGKYDKSLGVLVITEGDKDKPIGVVTEHNPPLNVKSEEVDVMMIFSKVESVDVVIRNLEKVKKLMKEGQAT